MGNIQTRKNVSTMQRLDLALLTRKFTIKLTRGQFEVLHQMLQTYLVQRPSNKLAERAFYYEVYKIYEKLNGRIMGLTAMVSLTFNLSQVHTLLEVIDKLSAMLPSTCAYEHTLMCELTRKLDQQTV